MRKRITSIATLVAGHLLLGLPKWIIFGHQLAVPVRIVCAREERAQERVAR